MYLPDFPAWLGDWAPYFSFMRYGFEGCTLNEFNNNPDLPLSSNYLANLGFNNSITQNDCAASLMMFVFGYAFFLLMALKFVDFEQR